MAFTDSTFRGDLNTYAVDTMLGLDNLIGLKVFPQYGVPTKTGQYPRFKIQEGKLLDSVDTIRNPNGSYNEIVREYTQQTYSCEDRGLEERVDDTYRADVSRFFNAEVAASQMLTKNVALRWEEVVADELYDNSTFNTTSATVNYTNTLIETIDFMQDLNAAVERISDKGIQANTIVMSNTLKNQILRSTLFQNYAKPYDASNAGIISERRLIDILSSDFNLEVMIGKSVKQTSNVRGTSSTSKIWSNDYIWVGDVGSGDPYSGRGVGRTFAWEGDGGTTLITESYRDEARRSDMIRVRHNVDAHVINPNAGELITTNYSAS